MAYGKRSTYRRKGRRGNRSLSTRRIFSNKGAKAQAKQIYALRRAVNSVRAQCRPEVKVKRSAIDNRGLALSSNATPGTVNWSRIGQPMPVVGTGDSERIGNKIRIVNAKMLLTLQYRELMNTSQSYYNSTLNTHGIQVRLIAVQSKTPQTAIPDLIDILQEVDFSGQIQSQMMLRQPFKVGITSHYNILLDKRMTVNLDNPIKSYRISLKPKSRSVVWEDGITRGKGEIFWFVIGGGYDFERFESGENYVYDSNLVDFTFKMETAYTDA